MSFLGDVKIDPESVRAIYNKLHIAISGDREEDACAALAFMLVNVCAVHSETPGLAAVAFLDSACELEKELDEAVNGDN